MIYDPKDNSATWEGGRGPRLQDDTRIRQLHAASVAGGNRFYGFDASGEIITKSGPAEPRP